MFDDDGLMMKSRMSSYLHNLPHPPRLMVEIVALLDITDRSNRTIPPVMVLTL